MFVQKNGCRLFDSIFSMGEKHFQEFASIFSWVKNIFRNLPPFFHGWKIFSRICPHFSWVKNIFRNLVPIFTSPELLGTLPQALFFFRKMAPHILGGFLLELFAIAESETLIYHIPQLCSAAGSFSNCFWIKLTVYLRVPQEQIHRASASGSGQKIQTHLGRQQYVACGI